VPPHPPCFRKSPLSVPSCPRTYIFPPPLPVTVPPPFVVSFAYGICRRASPFFFLQTPNLFFPSFHALWKVFFFHNFRPFERYASTTTTRCFTILSDLPLLLLSRCHLFSCVRNPENTFTCRAPPGPFYCSFSAKTSSSLSFTIFPPSSQKPFCPPLLESRLPANFFVPPQPPPPSLGLFPLQSKPVKTPFSLQLQSPSLSPS